VINTIGNRTILVVDDTDDVRELVRAQLLMLGYQVLEATNGQEAVEIVSKEPPELILMDLTMPVLGGIEATRMIRETVGNSQVVIIAFTALPSACSRQLALAAGCNDYIQKPLEVDTLSRLLERHLMAA
jgi:CheY-like chemotaxis protein